MTFDVFEYHAQAVVPCQLLEVVLSVLFLLLKSGTTERERLDGRLTVDLDQYFVSSTHKASLQCTVQRVAHRTHLSSSAVTYTLPHHTLARCFAAL